MSKYPQLEKMKAARERSQSIGEFLEWAHGQKGLMLTCWSGNDLVLFTKSIEEILAEFFEIDLREVEREKCALMEEIRK